MDERVKEVQVWLNKTYKGVNGFEKEELVGQLFIVYEKHCSMNWAFRH